jgi:predicted nucleic acid-binding protein
VSGACIIDAGPLIAFLDGDSRFHAWVKEQAAKFPAPLLTCEPVIAEAAHLL